MPTVPFYQVDAFTRRPFAGNPAAVCPLEEPIDEATMQDVAAENNLSETAFFFPEGDGFRLRWFTPTVEVDLCGHATLASAFVLMTARGHVGDEVVFYTRSGALPVRRERARTGSVEGNDLFVLDLPALRPSPVAPDLAATVREALGREAAATEIPVLRASHLLAVLPTAADVRALSPDMKALAALGTGLCVTAPGDGSSDAPPRPGDAPAPSDADFVSRFFAPGFGIPEDPVTGSAHAMLAPYWGARLGKTRLAARQISRRGGELRCRTEGDRVLIGGHACLVIQGTLALPDLRR